MDVADERHVQLDDLGLQRDEAREPGVPRSQIVDRDAVAIETEDAHARLDVLHVVDRGAFGDLEDDAIRESGQGRGGFVELGVEQIVRVEVDEEQRLARRSVESLVNTALSQYLAWRDYSGSNLAIRIGNIELDPARRLVHKNSVPVRLTLTEFDLLHYLMLHAGFAMGHARILGAVWGAEYGGELEYLRTFVRQLRKKLEDDPAEPRYLLTDPWYGYRFRDVTVDTTQ